MRTTFMQERGIVYMRVYMRESGLWRPGKVSVKNQQVPYSGRIMKSLTCNEWRAEN
jgi:hypothetical protein